MSQKDVALFPIPRCVSFPGTTFPLHVFEPRYRAMVKHCIETGTYMAVCHTQKEVRPAKSNQSREEALNSNQATYKPYDVFSAGPCELREELEDGRMLIHVHLKQRYHALAEQQTLPFSIFSCEEFPDRSLSEEELVEAGQLKEKILNRLLAITVSAPNVQELLKSSEWQEKDPVDFSFELFGLLQLNPEILQQILESDSCIERMQTALSILNQSRQG